jgi:hypothetical protein
MPRAMTSHSRSSSTTTTITLLAFTKASGSGRQFEARSRRARRIPPKSSGSIASLVSFLSTFRQSQASRTDQG